MNYGTSLGAHDVVSPYTLDYRGTKTTITKRGRRWCFNSGSGRRCAPTFRQAVVLVKYELDMQSTYSAENPGGGTVLLALVSLAVGGVGTFFLMKYLSGTAPITDPALIQQAKVNLAALTPGSKLGLTYQEDPPPTAVTPAFTQGLAQFQATLNKQITSANLAQLQQQTGKTPPAFPVRTDGVLDRPTFDWLVYTNG